MECPSGRMNKQLFNKYYKKVASSDDRMGVLSEYVFAYLIIHCHRSCRISLAFQAFDINHDGTIDFGEFALALSSQSSNDLESQLDLSFSM